VTTLRLVKTSLSAHLRGRGAGDALKCPRGGRFRKLTFFALFGAGGSDESHNGRAPASGERARVPEIGYVGPFTQQSLDGRTLHPAAASVDEAHFGESFLDTRVEVGSDHGQDVPRLESVQVDLLGDGELDGPLGIGILELGAVVVGRIAGQRPDSDAAAFQ
jgi:hypothetical protein